MKKFKPHSTLSILFSTAFIVAFVGGHFASAQDKSALEVDIFATSAQIELVTPSGDVALVQLSGPIKQHVNFEGPNDGDADDDDNDGLDEVWTEIVEMDLVGTNPLVGQVRLHVHSNIPSFGQIREQVNNTPGVLDIPPFTPTGMADSFFDVFFRIELPDLGQSFFASEPKRLTGVITHKPPAPCDSYENQDQTPVIDANGRPTGYFLGKMTLEIPCQDDCDWNPGDAYKMHWPQLPDLGFTGMDLDISLLNLADDFKCTATGPINDIHIWASFRDDVLPSDGPDSLTFEISIYSDIPAIGGGWSMPGELLWSRTLKPGEYSVGKLNDSLESWYDPAKELYLQDNHTQAYQYNFCIKEEPFIQEKGAIYWLGIKELGPANKNYKFGWKTTTLKLRWNDDAVFFLPGNPFSFPLTYPKEHLYNGESLDLAFVITGGEEGQGKHDLGDAPDSSNSFSGASMLAYPSGVVANYPTVYQTGSPPYGPIHWQPDAFVYLGEIVTNESEADIGYDEDIKNNLVPPDDLSDLDQGDDGVQLSLILPPCQEVSFDFMVTFVNPLIDNPAYLNVWFDWNRDGDWNDTMVCPDGINAPEWAVQNATITNNFAGSVVLTTPKFMCWHPQTEGKLDPIWMRITISLQPWETIVGAAVSGGSGPADGYQYGETEDYLIYPRQEGEPLEYDWGDAPEGAVAAGYPTLAVTNGANHVIAGPWLGDKNDRPESEPDGQPDPDALGDDNTANDDENGVSIPSLIPGQPADITLEVNGGGIVQAWIDFNSDMTWQPAEKIYDGFLPAGVHTISFFVPDSTMVGRTFARFRISKQGGLGPEGPAPNGEVEDHEVFVESIPQVTSRPGSATQCPVAETQCPSVATQCPPVNTKCPVVATQCPAVQTQCVAVTMCPPVNTTCPVAQTQCPAVATQCPPAPTKCPAEQTKCPPVQTRCPAIDTECPPLLTSCPPKETECSLIPTICQGVRTQCPAVETQCPPINTKCPPVETECPPIETKCNIEKTKCPPVQTQCPAVDTKCPSEPTKCPPVPTQCPAIVTECRAVETVCPAVTTQCPLVPTQCPITLTMMTQCPAVETRCPPQDTRCPVVDTQCPPVDTKCPGQDTKCPVALTRCPPEVSKCPPVPTQCTAADTQCPPVQTQCPVVDTKCPAQDTKCPVALTRCPPVVSKCPPVPTQCTAVDTQCPPSDTKCPVQDTKCPVAQTKCPPTVTECQQVRTQCPAPLTECLQIRTECPAVSTECPPVVSKCPPAPTQCTPVDTQCPAVNTRCPIEKTKCPVSETSCPIVQTKCPAPVTECKSEPTVCPQVVTQCPSIYTQCPPEASKCVQIPTTCPSVDTQCPLCPPPTIVGCPWPTILCPLGAGTKSSPYVQKCPAIDVQAPTVISKTLLAKAR